MPSLKISQLPSGSPAQTGDGIPIARANSNYSLAVSDFAALQTNQTLGIYASSQTTGQSSSSTEDARSITMVGMGNISIGMSAGSILISGTGGAGGGGIDVSLSGNTAGALALISSGTMILAGGNNITLSQNGQSVTISAANDAAQTNQTIGLYASSQTTGQSSSSTVDARSLTVVGQGIISAGLSAGSLLISATDAAQTVQTQNCVDLSLSGNTAGALALISSGTMILAGGNNITLSQNGQSVTISGANTVAQSQDTIGIYASSQTVGQSSSSTIDDRSISIVGMGIISVGLSSGSLLISATDAAQSVQTQNCVDLSLSGNTTGTLALISSGTAILAGGNNIVLSQNGQSVTISASNQSVQTQNCVDVSLSGNTTGTLALISSGTMILAGGNNITLSQNGQSVTISGAAAGGAQTGISSVAVSNTTYTSGQISFVNSNGLTFLSTTGQGILASYTVPTQSNQTLGIYGSSQTIGASSSYTYDARSLSIVGSNDISVGWTNSSFIIAGAPPLSRFVNEQVISVAPIQATIASASVFPIRIDAPLVFSNALFGVSIAAMSTAANTSSMYADISISMVMYTLNGSTLSSINSGSNTYTASYQSNSTASLNGVRALSIPMASATTLNPGEYWLGFWMTTNDTATNTSTATQIMSWNMSMICGAAPATAPLNLNPFNVGTNTSRLASYGLGVLTTNSTLGSFNISIVTGTGNSGLAAKLWCDLRNYTLW